MEVVLGIIALYGWPPFPYQGTALNSNWTEPQNTGIRHMPPRQLNLIKSTLHKNRPRFTFFWRFGIGGTVAHIIIYTASKHFDAIPTSHLHPLFHLLIWWIGAAIVVPFMPYRDQPGRQVPTPDTLIPNGKSSHVP